MRSRHPIADAPEARRGADRRVVSGDDRAVRRPRRLHALGAADRSGARGRLPGRAVHPVRRAGRGRGVEKIKTDRRCVHGGRRRAGASSRSRSGGDRPRARHAGALADGTAGRRCRCSCASASPAGRWWAASSVSGGSCSTCGATPSTSRRGCSRPGFPAGSTWRSRLVISARRRLRVRGARAGRGQGPGTDDDLPARRRQAGSTRRLTTSVTLSLPFSARLRRARAGSRPAAAAASVDTRTSPATASEAESSSRVHGIPNDGDFHVTPSPIAPNHTWPVWTPAPIGAHGPPGSACPVACSRALAASTARSA